MINLVGRSGLNDHDREDGQKLQNGQLVVKVILRNVIARQPATPIWNGHRYLAVILATYG